MSSKPILVDGVDYSTVPGTDLAMFRCNDHQATISTRGCASRWERAQKGTGRGSREALVDLLENSRDGNYGRAVAAFNLDACGRCPIGAAHAGRQAVHYASAYASDRCPRCGFATERMIGDRICVGCYNREREMRAGRNGRGNRPARLPGLVELQLRVTVDGRRQRPVRHLVAADHVARVKTGNRDKRDRPIYSEQNRGGFTEGVVQVLRTTRGVVDFLPIVRTPDVFWAAELPL